MDFSSILKFLPIEMIIMIIQSQLIKIGIKLKDKDDNDTGTDDAGGNVLIALAPLLPALVSGSDSVKRRVMLTAYNTFGNYLGFPPKNAEGEPLGRGLTW